MFAETRSCFPWFPCAAPRIAAKSISSEERYRAVVEQAAEGIFLFDAASGAILESNAALQELLGYTAAELLGMTIYDLVAHDRESIDSNVRRVVNEGGVSSVSAGIVA